MTVAILGFAITTIAQVTVTITAGGPTTFCIGNNVQLTSNIVPASIYQYQWVESGVDISGANTSTYTANATGSYVLKATALNGNIYNSNVIAVTVNPLPTNPSVTYTSPAIICSGGSINLSDNSSTNVSYQWYLNNNFISNASNSTYLATTGGNYKLEITDLTTGCSNQSQVAVGEMPNIIDNTIYTCGSSTTISLTSPNFSNSSLPSQCSIDMSNGNIVNTNIGGNGGGGFTTIICYGGRLTNQGGGNIFVVEYGGTIDFSAGSGGNVVYVKSGGICNITNPGGGGNIIYYEPGAIISPSGLVNSIQCNNIGVIYPSNTTSLCNNLSYLWSNGATTPTITVNPTQPTTYSVTVSNGSLTCTDQVIVTPIAVIPTITASGATTFCQGDSVILTSSSANGNNWSNGATTQSITVFNSGSFSVNVTNGTCTVNSTATNVTVNPLPTIPTITASDSTTFCQGDFVTLTSSSTNGNNWSNGATTQSINVYNSGSYSVSISNGNCSVSSSPTNVTVNPNPSVSFSTLNNFTNVNSSPIALNGIPSGGSYTGVGVSGSFFNPSLAGLGSTSITYNYTNQFGCSDFVIQNTIVYDTTGAICTTYDTITTYISVTDTLIINTILTGINPPNNLNIFKVFPNPANDHITIDNGNIANLTGYQIKITNSLSQQVFQSNITQQQFYVDLTTWTGNGIYFLYIIDGQGNTIDIKKIVLQ